MMPERVREIRFRHFRGLPDYSCLLKGKCLAVLGGNGKGKSAIVDGLEFLFAGHIDRFRGEGTGAINAADAIRHLRGGGEPQVELYFTPTNSFVRRALSSDKIEIPGVPSIQSYMSDHPSVRAFILRRSHIQEFITDQDATRYQKYMRLLGLSAVDSMQQAFVNAADHAETRLSRHRESLRYQLGVFRDSTSRVQPLDLKGLLEYCARNVLPLGISALENWEDLDSAVETLESKRSPETKARIDTLNQAIRCFERVVSTELQLLVDDVNTEEDELDRLRAAYEDAPKSKIIVEAVRFFYENKDVTTCPVCEQDIEGGYDAIFERLRDRQSSLSELEAAERKKRLALERLIAAVQRTIDQVADDLEHEALFEVEEVRTLRNTKAKLLRFQRGIKRLAEERRSARVDDAPQVDSWGQTRESVITRCRAERDSLIPPDAAQLENAILLLQKAKSAKPRIEATETEVAVSSRIVSAAGAARTAFSQAREVAIQTAFDSIASKVLSYYTRLHKFAGDESECTGLSLSPTARAAGGGLRLVIDFLGLAADRDPRAFLSEGHLDSLGLCLYLGTVRIFNRPGSLLVLDDILTSIDREHRHRVTELLLEEFGDFQLVVTTHDEYWFQMLQSSVQARGERGEWRFTQITRWTLEHGPESSTFEGTWKHIEDNLEEGSYRELGGPLRVVLEDFLKRVAAKIELEVRYNFGGQYTSGDFVRAGIQNAIRDKLIEANPTDEASIKRDVGRVFGMGAFINFLSHDNPGRLEITLQQTRDFVEGLQSLSKHCRDSKLIRGVSD